MKKILNQDLIQNFLNGKKNIKTLFSETLITGIERNVIFNKRPIQHLFHPELKIHNISLLDLKFTAQEKNY